MKLEDQLNLIPKTWQKRLKDGWIIQPASCNCGGLYAWMKPLSSGIYEMVGCICHTPEEYNEPEEITLTIKTTDGSTYSVREHYYADLSHYAPQRMLSRCLQKIEQERTSEK